jgi:putative membrane protein
MNTNQLSPKKIKQARIAIIIASVLIPLVVIVLFRVKIPGVDFSFLPPIYATINGFTAILLVAALIAIKNQKRKLHENIIKVCMLLSLLFLGLYVAYHMTSDSTAYLGEQKTLYYTILISHILLSVVVVPVVLFTYLFAWQGNFVRHKKWTRITWPLWFYVATTGVIVYWMISPYYS